MDANSSHIKNEARRKAFIFTIHFCFGGFVSCVLVKSINGNGLGAQSFSIPNQNADQAEDMQICLQNGTEANRQKMLYRFHLLKQSNCYTSTKYLQVIGETLTYSRKFVGIQNEETLTKVKQI